MEVEDLLRKGAYGALMDEEDEGSKFCEEDIDQILQRRTHTITIQSEGKGSTFAKVGDPPPTPTPCGHLGREGSTVLLAHWCSFCSSKYNLLMIETLRDTDCSKEKLVAHAGRQ